MPSISLGFEQVEVRLGLIRRRLNLLALQHTLYLGGSLAALSATLLIFLAVRGQTEAFNLALWIVILSGAAACSWAAYALRRRWLSIENVARLADQKGELDDRLSTLLAHRGNGPTRLWSLLLTQALTLSSRWDTRVVAPRRIPRSLFYLLGSLAILVATSFFVSAPSSEAENHGIGRPFNRGRGSASSTDWEARSLLRRRIRTPRIQRHRGDGKGRRRRPHADSPDGGR